MARSFLALFPFCLKTQRTDSSLFSFYLVLSFVSFHFFSPLFMCLFCRVSQDAVWALGSSLELKREIQRSQRHTGYLGKTKVKVGRRMRDDPHPSYTFQSSSLPPPIPPFLLCFIQFSETSITNSMRKSFSPSSVHWDIPHYTTSSSLSSSLQKDISENSFS